MLFIKVEVKSVLRIGCAHNNVRTSNVNIAQISNVSGIFLNINSFSYSFRSIANQNGVTYSDSTSYLKKYSSSKCKQTVCLHY
jgi:transcriptional regulator GlxA family with amidase domain